jgi:acetyltransferase-like isoleucine patch superfamily enzyme|tara:strand:- start:1744 stop:2478 length:735 start_codon:yes stop_codon:yes gene_type:complete
MIHPSAIISEKSVIKENVKIGPFSIIHDYVTLNKGAEIGAYCEIGIPTKLAAQASLVIGANSNIRSHAVIYAGSKIGSDFQTGHHITVRENSIIGDSCQLGSRGDIQGDCSIGNYTKMHSDVHIGKKSIVGSYVWLFPEVLLTNDPTPPSETLVGVTIEDFAVLASKVLVLPGIKIGKDSLVGAGSVVKENIPSGKLATGSPAKVLCNADILRHHDNPKLKAYPWRRRFHRGYSESDIADWINE